MSFSELARLQRQVTTLKQELRNVNITDSVCVMLVLAKLYHAVTYPDVYLRSSVRTTSSVATGLKENSYCVLGSNQSFSNLTTLARLLFHQNTGWL